MRRTFCILLIAAAAAVVPHVADGGKNDAAPSSTDVLRTHVWPAVARAPASVRVQALVERADDNRSLEIEIDSDAYSRRSRIALDGSRAARVHTIEFRSLPEGRYDVHVALTDRTGRVRAEQRDTVVIVH